MVSRSWPGCCICERARPGEAPFETVVTESGEPTTDGWYLHVHDVGDFEETGRLIDPDIYAFCPEHAPPRTLPTAGEDPSFDIDVFVGMLRRQHGE